MAPNRNYLAMEALVDELVRSGVRDACVSPGNRSAPLAFALARADGIRVWTHVDERSSAFFALGLARATRRPVAVACTSGTAAANFLPAAVEANLARVPLVLLTADRPPELHERGAAQTIDQNRLFGSHVRWFFDLGVPEPTDAGLRHVRAAACRAVAEAVGAPAGVVHLNLPMRDPLDPAAREDLEITEVAGSAGHHPHTSLVRNAERLDERVLEVVAARLAAAERPVIYAGPLDSAEEHLAADVFALAEALEAPVLAEPISNLRCSALAPLRVDAYEALLRDEEFAAAARPDLVLRLGAPPTSRTVATWLEASRPESVVLDDGAGWRDPTCTARFLLRGHLGTTCRILSGLLASRGARAGWSAMWRAAGGRAEEALDASLEREGRPFEGHVVRAVAQSLPENARLYVASSMAVRDLDWFWPRSTPDVRVLANRGANGIDGFVSSVLGAAADGTPVVGVGGDLSFFHDIGGLVAGRRHGLRACFVVSNNDGGGIFEFLPTARGAQGYSEHFEDLFVTPLGLELGPLVRGFGADHERVERVQDIAPRVEAALACPGVSVVEVAFDREHSRQAHARAWEAVRGAGGAGA